MSSLPPPPAAPPVLPPVLPPTSPRPADHAGRLQWLLGLLVTVGLVAALGAAWPEDEGPQRVDAETSTTLMTAEVAAQLGAPTVGGFPTPEVPLPPTVEPTRLFVVGPEEAVGEVLQAAGGPSQLHGIAVYPTYLFVAYRDPADPSRIDRRLWRDGAVGEAEGNPIDDTVDASTEPELFTVDELELALSLLPAMVLETPGHYPVPVEVTHVLIDRFLPFDDRVLVRIYASPPDDPTKGGYVTYTADGVFQKVCC